VRERSVADEQVVWARSDWYCERVLSGVDPVEKVYENDQALAFHVDLQRGKKKLAVHVMVIPKRHVPTLLDLAPNDGALVMGLIDAVQGTARTLGLEKSGFYMRINCLPPYQHTGHMHWHVMVDEPKAGGGESIA
jgi:histidine triad (HIT) family protein